MLRVRLLGTAFAFFYMKPITKKLNAMKTIHTILAILVFGAATAFVTAQDYPDEYLGLPGDNLNLYAVMNLFQESETLEKFEQDLNSQEQMINNLDLNGDNLIDYITVSDYVDGNVHNIVLRAALSSTEQQDVAVFVVEQMSNGAVQIQLIGDEALYGPNYIVEPIYAETPNPGYTGKVYRRNVNVVTTTYYDIATWPLIRFIFHPGYVVWRSSWYWGYYPGYWRPWRAHYWHYYYGYHYHWHNHYYTHYRHWNHYRCRNYRTYYRSKVRVYSPTVAVNINKGRYRNTYSRPEQRRAGEQYYAQRTGNRGNAARQQVYNGRTNSRSGTVQNRQGVQRSSTSATRTGSNVSTARTRSNVSAPRTRSNVSATRTRSTGSTTARSNNGSRQTSVSRNSNVRSEAARYNQPVHRSSVRPSAQRTSNQNPSATVQRSSSKKSAPTVKRSSSSNRSSAVMRSQPSRSKSAVQRSQPSRSKSTVQRSSSKKSTPTVKSRSSSNRSSAVKRSPPGRSKSSVQRSQPGRSKSSVNRSSSSSRKSAASSRSSSSSRRR